MSAALARAGRFVSIAYYLSRIEQVVPRLSTRYVPPILGAMLWAEAGRGNSAISWLEKAAHERDPQVFTLKQPFWDTIRADARLQALSDRLGLDQAERVPAAQCRQP